MPFLADIRAALQKNVLFHALGEPRLIEFAQAAHAATHDKGHILFLSGDSATQFFLITSGWIKLYRETQDGTQAVIDILTSGHIFGDTSLFEDDLYPYSAEVVEKSEILSFPLGLLKQEIETNHRFAKAMLTSMARYRRQQDLEIEHRAIQNAPQRIGCFLLRLTPQREGDLVTVRLPYDKTLIATRLGMQPETFSRALARLRDETGIRIKGTIVEMESLARLTEYSCGACSSGFPCKDV